MTPTSPYTRRKNVFINPRFQGKVALVFAAVVFAGGAIFAFLIYRDSRAALWDASMRGHYMARTPYQIVREIVLRDLTALFLGVLVSSAAAFFLLIRSIRRGVIDLLRAFGRSEEGDLSTPTAARGLKDVARFGGQVDEIRAHTLALIDDVRREADALRKEPLPEDEFQRRWEDLKRRIGRVAP